MYFGTFFDTLRQKSRAARRTAVGLYAARYLVSKSSHNCTVPRYGKPPKQPAFGYIKQPLQALAFLPARLFTDDKRSRCRHLTVRLWILPFLILCGSADFVIEIIP